MEKWSGYQQFTHKPPTVFSTIKAILDHHLTFQGANNNVQPIDTAKQENIQYGRGELLWRQERSFLHLV